MHVLESAARLQQAVPDAVLLVRQLSDPRPADTAVIDELSRYEGLAARWHDGDDVRTVRRARSGDAGRVVSASVDGRASDLLVERVITAARSPAPHRP